MFLTGAVLLAFIGIGLGGAGLWVLDIASSAPSIDTLKPADSGANSEIIDAEGKSLGFVQADVLREPTTLKRIPDTVEQATISIEDENFYDHSGVDYSAIVRAAVENLEAGEVRQGASTITQQLVRNLFIEDPEDTIERKIIEAEMSREYEEAHSKDEILEAYLNTAAYGTNNGRTAVGVAAAAEVFFDKNIKNVGIKEAALLAGLPQAPTDYNPFLNKTVATERRNQVLGAMAEQGYISEGKAQQLAAQGLGLERGFRYEQRDEQFFFDYVQQELIDTYGQKTVREGGLQVYTTLQPKLQAAAEQAIADNPVTSAASALVSTNTETGEILAMASSTEYDSSQFNLAADGERQPGSAFKPFVLTTAVDEGIDPDSTSYPAPSTITLNPDQYTSWTVSGGGGKSMTLRQATANSINTVYAQLGIDVGPSDFAAMAEKLGIRSPLDGYYAEALGGTTQCCTVLEMSNAYATIANGGVHHDPTAIKRVEFPDGEVDEPDDGKGERVLTDGVAYKVADVMKGTLDYGTAAGNDLSCPAAGKTGTTEEQSDAWFVGYTPKVSTAVWTGNPNERVPLPGYGASLSAPIWNDYMDVAIGGFCEDFPEPKNPPDLSSYISSQTISGAEYDSSTTTDADETDPSDAGGDPAEPGTDADGDGYDDGAYAPGVQGDPPPTGGDKKK
ncbi:MAG TPA: transglycosylase domain-containing protein [Solirubrobacterales bacterium]|nr:transglycosylase domain-containing protein [Solirubrobacterales bacterium]